MSYTFDSYIYNQSSGVATVTSGIITLTNDALIVVILDMGDSVEQTDSAMSDTLSNTWVKATASHAFSPNVFGGTTREIWYCLSATGGSSTITATWGLAGGYGQIQVLQYTLPASVTFDSADGLIGNGTTPSLSITPTNSGLVVGGFQDTEAGYTWSAPFTDRTGGLYELNAADTASTGGDGITATGTGASGGDWVGSLAAFDFTVPPSSTTSSQIIYFGW